MEKKMIVSQSSEKDYPCPWIKIKFEAHLNIYKSPGFPIFVNFAKYPIEVKKFKLKFAFPTLKKENNIVLMRKGIIIDQEVGTKMFFFSSVLKEKDLVFKSFNSLDVNTKVMLSEEMHHYPV